MCVKRTGALVAYSRTLTLCVCLKLQKKIVKFPPILEILNCRSVCHLCCPLAFYEFRSVWFYWLTATGIQEWYYRYTPVTVAAPSKAAVSGRSLAGIAGSNPSAGMDACLLWVFVLSSRGLRDRPIPFPEGYYRAICVCVRSRNLGLDPSGAAAPQEKNYRSTRRHHQPSLLIKGSLTLIVLMCRIGWAHNNARK